MQKVHAKRPGSPGVLLTVAGFDSSSGAGLTADLRTFADHGFFGLSCATVLTVQSTRGVLRSVPVEAQMVAETLACLAEDLPIDGVKIGAMGSEGAVQALADWLEQQLSLMPAMPVVLDPVLRASSGAALLEPGAEAALRDRLLPLATAVTPNLAEAAVLAGICGRPSDEVSANAETMAEAIATRMNTGVRVHAGAVVITGGHRDDAPHDYILHGGIGSWLHGAWVETMSTHGTGCAFSSALLCALVRGKPVTGAVQKAKQYVYEALRSAYPLGGGHGPLHYGPLRSRGPGDPA